MMKKTTWKKLFTRSKSKNREKAVVCNMCAGVAIVDVVSLCDQHRLEGLRLSGANSTSQQDAGAVTKVDSQNPPPVGILKNSDQSSVNKPETEKSVAQQPPASTLKEEAEKSAPAATIDKVEEPVNENGTLEELSKAHQADTTKTSKTDAVKLDRTATNEEFMTEEVDSPNLSENSRTEETAPIVIEPSEEPKQVGGGKDGGEVEKEESKVKQRVSFTSLPGKVHVIPSSEEETEALEEAIEDSSNPAAQKAAEHKRDEPNFEHRSRGSLEERLNRKNTEITLANQIWFGTSQPGSDKPADVEPKTSESAADSVPGSKSERPEKSLPIPIPTKAQDVMTQPAPSNVSHDVWNPDLSGPTPLSDLLPNVFMTKPKDSSDNSLTPQYQPESSRQVLTNEYEAKEADGPSSNTNANFSCTVQGEEPGGGQQDEGHDNISTSSQEESEEEQVDYDETDSGTGSDTEELAGNGKNEFLQENVSIIQQGMQSSKQRGSSKNQTSEKETATNATRMVFGTITSDFSSQPLFFSPNFGVQGVRPVGSSQNGQESILSEEPPFPNFSIFGMMKDFLTQDSSSGGSQHDGRVTELTESSEGNAKQNTGETSNEQKEDSLGQSPPSLEDEEDFEINPETTKDNVEDKELKRE